MQYSCMYIVCIVNLFERRIRCWSSFLSDKSSLRLGPLDFTHLLIGIANPPASSQYVLVSSLSWKYCYVTSV